MAATNPFFVRNTHTVDRAVRVVLGFFLISLVFWGPKTLLGLSGLILLATAAIGFCPLYRLVGLSTCADDACRT